LEVAAWEQGYRLVAGVDEAGRGAWAGPVAAAAVILPPNRPDLRRRLDGVRDSKTLSARQRDALFEIIHGEAVAVGVGMVDPDAIVAGGIMVATRQAMAAAIRELSYRPDFLLIDYLRLPQVDILQRGVRKGDERSLSIAAASIVAKVSRDRLMVEMADALPHYGFERHKGYGTRAHWAAIRIHGATPFHRYTWAPFRRLKAFGRPSLVASSRERSAERNGS